MALTLKVKKEFAQQAKEFLLEKGWLDKSRILGSTPDRYVILALTESAKQSAISKKFPTAKFEHKSLPLLPPRIGNLKDLLRGILKEKEIDELIKSYDVVGDICILDIPKKLEKHELAIGHAIKRAYQYIKVVARKSGNRTKTLRIMPLKIITGEKRLNTIHKENGVFIKVDLLRAYFSPRASGERARIARLVKREEKVLVMFGGTAPSALAIAKSQPDCRIWTVDLNEDAHRLAAENVRINRFGHIITPLLGDVRDVLPKLNLRFDRIVMPFPEENWDYLGLALRYVEAGGIIHFLVFVREGEVEKTKERILKIAEKAGRKVKIKDVRLFGSYAPRVNRYVFDVEVK